MDLDKFFLEEESNEGFNFDFKRYWRGFYKRKWLLLAIFLIVLAPWIYIIKKQPPVYEAYSLIRFKNFDPDRLLTLKEGWYTDLSSRTFAERIVSELGLVLELESKDKKTHPPQRGDVFTVFRTTKHPKSGHYVLKFLGTKYQLFRLTDKTRQHLVLEGSISEITTQPVEVNGFVFQINPKFVNQGKEVYFRIKNFKEAVHAFRKHIDVHFNQSGSLMRLSMTDRNPELVAPMVNELARLFIKESVSSGKQRQETYTNLLQKRLEIAKENLQKANEELKLFKQTHIVNLDKGINTTIENLSELEKQISVLKENKDAINLLLEKLKNQESASNDETVYIYGELSRMGIFKDNPSMGILRQQLSDLRKKRSELTKKVSDTHPDVVALDKKIAQTEQEMQDLARKELQNIARQIRYTQNQIALIKGKLHSMPAEQLKLADLTQKVEVANNIYSNLLAKYQEAQISQSVDAGSVDILDPAIPPDFPINRDKMKKMILGIFFALFISSGVGFLLEFLDKTIKTPEDVKRYLGLSVIGSIPKVKFDEELELNDADKIKRIDAQLVTYDYSPTPIGEAYRALRTKIMFSKSLGKIRTLVVTSFAPGDGKSFTSSNLAITFAQHKTRILLVDADLRRGVQHNTFSVSKEPGFSNYLMGVASLESIVQETHVPNLFLVSCGSMIPNPSELLGSLRLKRFIDEVKRRFDFIMFDTPPLNAATDSVVLGTQVDGLLIIARAEATNRNIAKQKLDLFENVPVNIVGVVLNGAEQDLAHEGYSYYHY